MPRGLNADGDISVPSATDVKCQFELRTSRLGVCALIARIGTGDKPANIARIPRAIC